MEAEEIARLATDLEQAVRTANAEAQRRRDAEDRLVASERRLAHWKGSRDLGGRAVTDVRSLRPRSRSPPQSPRDGADSRRGAAGAVEKFVTRSGVSEARACAGGRAAAHAWGVGGSNDRSPERELKSHVWGVGESNDGSPEREVKKLLQPQRRAMGSTIASRGRRSASDRISGHRWESVGKGGYSESPPGGNKRRPTGASSPSPSRRRGGDSSARSGSNQFTTGRSSRDSEPEYGRASGGHFSRRMPNGTKTVAEEHRTVERYDSRREQRAIEGANASPRETQESPGARRRRPSLVRCEAGGSSRRSPVELRSGASDGVDRRQPGRAGPVAAGAITAEDMRERRASVIRHSKEDAPVTLDGGEVYADEEARKGSSNGRGGGRESMAETSVATTRGEELAATVARELRLAVATTSAASPVSVAGFPPGSTGGNTPSDRGNGSGNHERRRGGNERRDVKPDSRQREEDLLLPGRKDGSKHADSVRNPVPSVPLSGDCGQALKSREVAELESDVQHIFQFFSSARGFKAGQDGGGSSSCRAVEEKVAEARTDGGGREEDYGSAIAKALASWGMTGEGESG